MSEGRSERPRRAPACTLLWALLLAGAIAACRERPRRIELPPLPPALDGGADASVLPDGAIPCNDDADCDDGVACTRDICLPGRYCVNTSNSTYCSDGVYCNGQEVCDHELGCRPGGPRICNDEDVCTIDYCDESRKACVHEPRDFDDDGEVDWHCLGGTDCDDFDATRSQGIAEICGDSVDNDCDDAVDELSCGRPQHDSCEDALDVSSGGTFVVGLAGALPDYAPSCSTVSEGDVAFTFTTDKPRDVTIVAMGLLGDGSEETATVALRTSCNELSSELECSHGFPGQVRIRALPAGRYFAIASSRPSSRLLLEVRFAEATAAPSNVSCEAPLDISAGGRFDGDFVDVGDDEIVECGFAPAGDLVYSFTTQEERDVELSAISDTGERMNFAVRTVCDDRETTLRCLSASPARARLHQLPPGTYYVVLESSPSREVDFALDVAFLEPTPPAPGDSCTSPLELPLATSTNGTLANRQDLVGVHECGCVDDTSLRGCGLFWPEVVYRVEVDEPTDLFLDIKGSGPLAYELRSVCDSVAAKLTCGNGQTIGKRVRNLQAGDYYLILEAPDAANFSLRAEKMPRTTPVVVGGNDTCATPVRVPAEGGLFQGDTLQMLDHYQAVCGNAAGSRDATFLLELTEPRRVTATLEAEFDTVLYRHTDLGGGPETCEALATVCNDDVANGNPNSELSEPLDAGTYYYVVDGFDDENAGSYLIDFAIGPP